MALTKLTEILDIISALEDLPNDDNGLTPEQLKAKFDEAGNKIKTYLNNTLTTELDTNFATKTDLQGVTLGQLLDGSITPAKLSFDPATQPELDTVNSNLTTSISDTNTNLNNHMANTTKHLSIMTTQGDTIYQGASAPAVLPKGTGYQSYNMNAGATAPQWMASIQSLLTTQGDTLYASAANTPARLPKGAGYQLYRMNSGGTAPEWYTFSGGATGNVIFDENLNGGATVTKSIPLGVSATRGRLYIRNNTQNCFCIISFTTVATDATSMSLQTYSNTYSSTYVNMYRGTNSYLSQSYFSKPIGVVGAQIISCKINGTNLEITFTNQGVTNNLYADIHWEVDI